MPFFKSLIILAIILSPSLKANSSPPTIIKSGKAVVFDAGSSGTRVFIYDWQRGLSENEIPVITLPTGRTHKVNPGLATFSNAIDKIPHYLSPLIDFAKKIVGENNIAKTPLFFAATAGLRLEKQRNKIGYEKIINETKKILQKSGFKILGEPGVISGQEEGAYAWLSVNSLAKRLPGIIEGKDQGIGIVEMGGASFQLAFLPKSAPKKEAFTIVLNGKPLVLYAYSYGDLGENEARNKFSNKKYCEWNDDNKNAGDFNKCKKAIFDAILKAKGKECEECGIGKIFQPRLNEITKEFYALGALAYLNINFDINIVNANNLRKKGMEICDVSFPTAHKLFPKISSEIMKKQCFNLAYYSSVLTGNEKYDEDGIGFPGNTTMLIAKNEINNQEITWTLGLLMLAFNKYLAEFLQ